MKLEMQPRLDTGNTGGTWSVCSLAPGNYTVTETLKSGFKNITNLTQNVTLKCVNVTGVNFRNVPLWDLGGWKKDGCTGLGLGGWTITVKNLTTGQIVGTTQTT